MNLATKAIHVWQTPDTTTWAIIPPLYLTSTYVQEEPWVHKWYEYTRSWNPNFTNAEKTLAALEGWKHALIYNSWLWATTTIVLSLLQAGDKIVAIDDVYGGTFRLFKNVFDKFGIIFEQIALDDGAYVEEKLADPQVRMFWVESPTNPLLKTTDLDSVLAISKKHKVISVIDNTFATPYFQQPLALWADIILHSTTKYLWGHSDIIGGATITNNDEYIQKLSYHRNAAWLNPNAFDAWMLSRSLKTLSVRMKQHDENGKKIVAYLRNHKLVKKVYYPWFGGMVSVEFDLAFEQVVEVISTLEYFRLAESLWWVESLIEHPASMTHASIPPEIRAAQWLSDGLIRISVGIEDSDDLLADLDEKLSKY